jgi:2-phosphosulfolactate phosphatase
MRLHVDLTPNPPYGDELVVVVDVLRATTSIALLLEAGAREVWVARSTRAVRERAAADDLLLGEKEGLPPEGFHHGTSPAALARVDVRGRRVFYTSDHLPAALERVDRTEGVWLASLRNAPHLVERLQAAKPDRVVLVCAGFRGA